ncbi:hypothetical protein RFM41_15870 [Mesorhizobium sp. VK25A]|uniref:Uncharacterized protein n=1 Tax=Mesorhizobium vachelliae TaxID=3072309 RepID=A0ABU5A6J7_9HYPH|nr:MULTISPECIES: hypothetical protein [unclassified Mesorhizobium]MDX8533309.1 hypothetical protein [Mesorhizobium sp. VK25D]MDX8545228.1 hypothetical protein [Mesorhizobium sp. VK25A]
MAALSASELLRALPELRAFAFCLMDDRDIADALVEVVLVRGSCRWLHSLSAAACISSTSAD